MFLRTLKDGTKSLVISAKILSAFINVYPSANKKTEGTIKKEKKKGKKEKLEAKTNRNKTKK